jgi:hypothetical protein
VYVEHTIGILKGRFQSLQGLRIVVDKTSGHLKACNWIQACIVLHNILNKVDPWNGSDDEIYAEECEDESEENEAHDGSVLRNALVDIVNAMSSNN